METARRRNAGKAVAAAAGKESALSTKQPVTFPRKGARSRAELSPSVLAQLNRGELETATLAEGLAVDFSTLMRNVAPGINRSRLDGLQAGQGITLRMQAAGRLLVEEYGPEAFQRFARHASDTVRGWAAYALAESPGMALAERLQAIRPLADDPHFGVREWSWLALRPAIAAELREAIRLLTPWTADPSPRIRRFAVESTRPRGVWCSHLSELKAEPARALPLLEPIKSDSAPYVQDSAGNWLNDAAKSQPAWVLELCDRWQKESATPETARICKKALRSIAPKSS